MRLQKRIGTKRFHIRRTNVLEIRPHKKDCKDAGLFFIAKQGYINPIFHKTLKTTKLSYDQALETRRIIAEEISNALPLLRS